MIISEKVISQNTILKYLIVIPCVNREERNAINVIDKTFESFEKSGLFESDISVDILLFESGSINTNYLKFIEKYKTKSINVIYSKFKLNGNSNTYRMFITLASNKYSIYIKED